MITYPFVLYGQIIDGDCSGLIPACWQELHYLFAGIIIGLLGGLWLWHRTYLWWH
jgi:hypothetical protein